MKTKVYTKESKEQFIEKMNSRIDFCKEIKNLLESNFETIKAKFINKQYNKRFKDYLLSILPNNCLVTYLESTYINIYIVNKFNASSSDFLTLEIKDNKIIDITPNFYDINQNIMDYSSSIVCYDRYKKTTEKLAKLLNETYASIPYVFRNHIDNISFYNCALIKN